MQELFFRLNKLNLPANEFAIFGSGPISVRGLRKAKDLDIIANQNYGIS